jgi:crossover junction endodeoxyribonuclease RuvC
MRTVIGIDPGMAWLGFGVIEDGESPAALVYGVVATPPDWPPCDRLLHLYHELGTLFDRFRPGVVAMEQLFFARNVTTALAVGQARGIVLLVAAQRRVRIVEYKPAEVKQMLTGYGRATKTQMQEMVRLILGLPEQPRPDDAADALAIALCHVQKSRLERRLGLERETG